MNEHYIKRTICERLVEIMKINRYGIKDLAGWLGISYNGTYAKVRCRNEWSLSDMVKISKHLTKKDMDYIFLSPMFNKVENIANI